MEPVGNIFDLKKYAIHDGPGMSARLLVVS